MVTNTLQQRKTRDLFQWMNHNKQRLQIQISEQEEGEGFRQSFFLGKAMGGMSPSIYTHFELPRSSFEHNDHIGRTPPPHGCGRTSDLGHQARHWVFGVFQQKFNWLELLRSKGLGVSLGVSRISPARIIRMAISMLCSKVYIVHWQSKGHCTGPHTETLFIYL